MNRLAVIGGSGLCDYPELKIHGHRFVDTAWGATSAPVSLASLDNRELLFLPRHGPEHRIPPHRVNYRANLAALKESGAIAILAINVVGGIDPQMRPGDLVIPHQIIDYTWGREHTYSDGSDAPLQHVDFSRPYAEELRTLLLESCDKEKLTCRDGAVYGVTQGPRLETAAEIERMRRDGCDIVGMTAMPEAALARELGIPYACLALVVNPAAGLGEVPITLREIEEVMNLTMMQVKRIIRQANRRFSNSA